MRNHEPQYSPTHEVGCGEEEMDLSRNRKHLSFSIDNDIITSIYLR